MTDENYAITVNFKTEKRPTLSQLNSLQRYMAKQIFYETHKMGLEGKILDHGFEVYDPNATNRK